MNKGQTESVNLRAYFRKCPDELYAFFVDYFVCLDRKNVVITAFYPKSVSYFGDNTVFFGAGPFLP